MLLGRVKHSLLLQVEKKEFDFFLEHPVNEETDDGTGAAIY